MHAYIISILKRDMPSMFGKDSKKKELINKLPEVYKEVERTYQISPGDFPSLSRMREVLKDLDFTKFHALKPRMIEKVDTMLSSDMTRLMQMIPTEESIDKKHPGLANLLGTLVSGAIEVGGTLDEMLKQQALALLR